jgi:hypothetical protein
MSSGILRTRTNDLNRVRDLRLKWRRTGHRDLDVSLGGEEMKDLSLRRHFPEFNGSSKTMKWVSRWVDKVVVVLVVN